MIAGAAGIALAGWLFVRLVRVTFARRRLRDLNAYRALDGRCF